MRHESYWYGLQGWPLLRSRLVRLCIEQEQDMPWAVVLQLGKILRKTLAPMTTLRLLDCGGLEWTRPRVDRNGRISFGWYRTDVSPEQRLRRYPCRLEIV